MPSWCDRVLWRSPPGPWGLTGDSRSGDCDEITVSDHAPIFTALEIEVRSRSDVAHDMCARGCICMTAYATACTLRYRTAWHAAHAHARCARRTAPRTERALVQVPVLPAQPTLHHCTLYLSKLALYRCRPPERANTRFGVGLASP